MDPEPHPHVRGVWLAALLGRPGVPAAGGLQPDLLGYQKNGRYSHGSKVTEQPAIVDRVLIPKDLAPGPYVVSWRWDCEQTAQIWAGCGDVVVTAS